MISYLFAGAVAGLAVAMPIGAVGSYLVGLAARERTAIAVAAALGIASVDGGYAIVAAAGGASLQTMLGEISGWLTYAAAITLVVVAVHTMRTALRRFRGDVQTRAQLSKLTPARTYLSLVALTAINPATVVTFAAVVLGRSSSEGGASWLAVALFALGAFGASASWQLLLAGGGSLLGRLLRTRRGQLRISLCSAVVMLGLAVGVLLS
jgi:arginine exporter protein ArgO